MPACRVCGAEVGDNMQLHALHCHPAAAHGGQLAAVGGDPAVEQVPEQALVANPAVGREQAADGGTQAADGGEQAVEQVFEQAPVAKPAVGGEQAADGGTQAPNGCEQAAVGGFTVVKPAVGGELQGTVKIPV